MPFHTWKTMQGEVVTPKHSTAFGPLITGSQVEVGLLQFKGGEGAHPHAHPHEQVIVMLKGMARFTLDGEVRELVPGMAVHIPPNVLHRFECLEDAEVVSCKGIVGGVGHRI